MMNKKKKNYYFLSIKKIISDKGFCYFFISRFKIVFFYFLALFKDLRNTLRKFRLLLYWSTNSNRFWLWYGKTIYPLLIFKFNGKTYNYFANEYNNTWRNERAVEIPIIWEIVKRNFNKNILEVGNVLSNYFTVNHDIVDKYEKVNAVINKDIVDFDNNKRYDLIISISTLEHVGWDERPRNPSKILRAIDNLKKIIVPKGKIVITLPIGQNYYLDDLIMKKKIDFSNMFYLKRISKGNKWKQVNRGKIKNLKYGSPFKAANGIIIGIIEENKINKANM